MSEAKRKFWSFRFKLTPVRGLLLALVSVLVLWLGCLWFALLGFNENSDFGRFGQLGDTFGTLNALLAGLAFAGTIYTISQQNGQIKEQREAMAKESAERNVNARLNTYTALLEAVRDERDKLDPEFTLPSYFSYLRTKHTRLRQKIELLSRDAEIGFDEPFTQAQRKEKSILMYLKDVLYQLAGFLKHRHPLWQSPSTLNFPDEIMSDIRFISELSYSVNYNFVYEVCNLIFIIMHELEMLEIDCAPRETIVYRFHQFGKHLDLFITEGNVDVLLKLAGSFEADDML